MLRLLRRVTPVLLLVVLSMGLEGGEALAQLPPGVSGALSVVPGLGQVTNGDALEGVGWFAVSVGLFVSGNAYLRQMGFDLWMYNMYDAYRDAGAKRTTSHSFVENWIGAFNPANLIDPIGAPTVAVAALSERHHSYTALRKPGKIATYSLVGLGEEGLFRGFLFPGISELTHSKGVGAVLSSAAFAYAHALGGAANLKASPLAQRFILGMLFCIQVNRNAYDLRKNIFAHAWYDILVDRSGTQIEGFQINVPF